MRSGLVWNPRQELHTTRREVAALLGGGPRWGEQAVGGPAFNLHAGEAGVVLTAELPGYDAAAFDISVKNDVVSIRGTRPPDELAEGAKYLARERTAGGFEKSFRLPFTVDAAKTDATYEKGVLTIRLDRPTEPQPHKVGVRTV